MGVAVAERTVRRTADAAWPNQPATVTFSALQCPPGGVRAAIREHPRPGYVAIFAKQVPHA